MDDFKIHVMTKWSKTCCSSLVGSFILNLMDIFVEGSEIQQILCQLRVVALACSALIAHKNLLKQYRDLPLVLVGTFQAIFPKNGMVGG